MGTSVNATGYPAEQVSRGRGERYAAVAGILFVILVMVSIFAFPDGPSSNDPAGKIAGYYIQHHALDLVSDYWSFLASVPFIVFLAGMFSMLRRADPGSGALPVLAFSTGLIAYAFELIATAIEFALASSVYGYAQPGLIKALYVVASREFFTSNLFFAFFLGTASLALLRTLVLPRWIGWIGLAGTAAFAVSALAVADPHGPLGVALLLAELLALLWIALTSIFMLQRTVAPADEPGQRQTVAQRS